MGLQDMLKAGAQREAEAIAKLQAEKNNQKKPAPVIPEPKKKEVEQVNVPVVPDLSAEPVQKQKPAAEAAVTQDEQKREVLPEKKERRGGRPTNKEKGLDTRKQYSLTLKESTYSQILEEAEKDEITFARFMERAALFYIEHRRQQ